MSDVRYTEIMADEAGQRLDNYLMRILKGVPKSHIYRIIRGGEVRINKKRVQAATRLMAGDSIRIPPVRTSADKSVFVGDKLAQRLKDSIIFEDNHLLVINKPAGIAVHGGSGLSLGVIEALRKIRHDLSYLELVHRLDRDTSGCLLLAKKRSALRAIQAALETRKVNKTYWALLVNPWTGSNIQEVQEPLVKNTLKSGERVVSVHPEGKPSETQFKLLENFESACLVEVSPKTGRTHQIRVHGAWLGHSVVGDEKYGEARLTEDLRLDYSRLYLHARAIQFNLNGKEHAFEADLDNPFAHSIKQLRTRSVVTHE